MGPGSAVARPALFGRRHMHPLDLFSASSSMRWHRRGVLDKGIPYGQQLCNARPTESPHNRHNADVPVAARRCP